MLLPRASPIPFGLFVCALNVLQTLCDGIQCGRPGRPENGTASPNGQAYFPGEKVSYACLDGFVLFGDEPRTCLKNGTWSGEAPICDFNLARGKRAIQSDTLWSYSPGLAVDGNRDTCSFTPRGPDPRWWQVHLGHVFNVVAIGVTISPGSVQEFTIFVIDLLADNKALYKPCTTFKGVFETHKGIFKCNDGLGHPGQFVYIRDDRQEEDYFGLCEVEVFAFRETIPCGEPEIPVNGRVTRERDDLAVYSCDAGTKLEGDAVLACSSKGLWSGQVAKCSEVTCSAPPHVDDGYIEIGNPRGEYFYGTVARYGCSSGYVLRGPRTRRCGQDGTWSGDTPYCQGVSCGDPPVFQHSRYTLLNDSRHGSAIAVYSCDEHFRLSTRADTITTCLDTGLWRPVNFTCFPDPPLHLSASSQNSPNSHLVVVLAVIAGILAVGMLAFGILLVRKRLLSGPGTLLPLLRSGDKQTPSGSMNYVGGLENSSQYQTNILQNFSRKDYGTQLNCSDGSSVDCDPPYERVKPNSENSYQTLGETRFAKSDSETLPSQDTVYECVESAKNGEARGRSDSDSGYEVVKAKDSDYETLMETEPSANYDASSNGYETLKPKLPPRDIIRPSNDFNREPSQVPKEILALYAKVDKSKKKNFRENLDGSITKFDDPPEEGHESLRPLPPIPRIS